MCGCSLANLGSVAIRHWQDACPNIRNVYDCNGTTPTHRMPGCWPFNWKLRGVGILADGTFVGGSEGPNSTTTVTRFRRDPHTGNCSLEQPFWLEKAHPRDELTASPAWFVQDDFDGTVYWAGQQHW